MKEELKVIREALKDLHIYEIKDQYTDKEMVSLKALAALDRIEQLTKTLENVSKPDLSNAGVSGIEKHHTAQHVEGGGRLNRLGWRG